MIVDALSLALALTGPDPWPVVRRDVTSIAVRGLVDYLVGALVRQAGHTGMRGLVTAGDRPEGVQRLLERGAVGVRSIAEAGDHDVDGYRLRIGPAPPAAEPVPNVSGALAVLRGPAGGGKSQYARSVLRAGEAVIELQPLYASLRGLARLANGRYPTRHGVDRALELAQYGKATATREAARRGIPGYVSTASSSPEAVERLRERGATGPVTTIDPGEETVRVRLADEITQEVQPACEDAIFLWYGQSESQRALGVAHVERNRRRMARSLVP